MRPTMPPTEPDGVYTIKGREETKLPFKREVKGMYIDHPIKGITAVEKSGFHPVMDETGHVENVPTLMDTAIRTWWELDSDEVAAIMQTRQVVLTIHGEPVPPVALGVAAPADLEMDSSDFEPPIARAHLRRALDLLVDKLTDMGHAVASAEDIEEGLNQCLLETAAGYEG